MVGLLHDATEAYTCDMPRPLKLHMPEYKEIEHRNWLAICENFSMSPLEPPILKTMDLAICLTERAALMSPSDHDWGIGIEAPKVTIGPWRQRRAELEFLDRWVNLGEK